MNMYEKNLKLLKIKKLQKKTLNYKIVNAKNGEETLQVFNVNKNCYYHSSYNPTLIAKEYISTVKVKKNSIFVILGLGLGYELIELVKKCNKDNIIYVIEKDIELVHEFIKKVDLTNLSKQTNIYIPTNFKIGDMSNMILSTLKSTDSYGMVCITNMGALNIFKEEYLKLFNLFNGFVERSVISINTRKRYEKVVIKNNLYNTKHLFESYSLHNMQNIFKDKPAIIVSAGPSLNKNIHLLKKAKGKFLIFSTYTAYNALVVNDIIPDFVCALDGFQPVLKDKKIKSNFIAFDLLNYTILENCTGKKLFALNCHSVFIKKVLQTVNKKVPIADSGGSISHNILTLLHQMKCNPIITVGQDLAFENRKMHVDNAILFDVKETLKYKTKKEYDEELNRYSKIIKGDTYLGDLITVDGYYGSPVETSELFKAYLDWFDVYITSMMKNVTVINATEGGAKIKGTIQMSLDEVINKYSKDNFVESTLEKLFTNENKLLNIKECTNIYLLLKNMLEEFTKLSNSIKNYNSKSKTLTSKNQILDEIINKSNYIHYLDATTKLYFEEQEKLKYNDELLLQNNNLKECENDILIDGFALQINLTIELLNNTIKQLNDIYSFEK